MGSYEKAQLQWEKGMWSDHFGCIAGLLAHWSSIPWKMVVLTYTLAEWELILSIASQLVRLRLLRCMVSGTDLIETVVAAKCLAFLGMEDCQRLDAAVWKRPSLTLIGPLDVEVTLTLPHKWMQFATTLQLMGTLSWYGRTYLGKTLDRMTAMSRGVAPSMGSLTDWECRRVGPCLIHRSCVTYVSVVKRLQYHSHLLAHTHTRCDKCSQQASFTRIVPVVVVTMCAV